MLNYFRIVDAVFRKSGNKVRLARKDTAAMKRTVAEDPLLLEVKAQVEEAKFGSAAALARLGVDSFFLEMDVWLLRDPTPLFSAAAHDATATATVTARTALDGSGGEFGVDVVISAHQENYMDLNAGFYWVRANERTNRLFGGMLAYLLANPSVWDQSLMCKLR